MTYYEVLALLKEEVKGVRKAIYGVEVREYIARSMEAVIEMVRLGIERMKELASDSKRRSRKEERDECQKQRGFGKAIFGQGEKRHCRSQIGV